MSEDTTSTPCEIVDELCACQRARRQEILNRQEILHRVRLGIRKAGLLLLDIEDYENQQNLNQNQNRLQKRNKVVTGPAKRRYARRLVKSKKREQPGDQSSTDAALDGGQDMSEEERNKRQNDVNSRSLKKLTRAMKSSLKDCIHAMAMAAVDPDAAIQLIMATSKARQKVCNNLNQLKKEIKDSNLIE